MLKLVVLSVILALCTAEPSGLVYSAPLVAAVPAARSYSYRADLVSQPLVTVPVAQKLISSPVVAAPVLQKIVTPVATSYSARVDALRSPLVAAYPASLHPCYSGLLTGYSHPLTCVCNIKYDEGYL